MSMLLLVDTDPLTLRVLDVSLRKAGFDVVTASDAAEAVAKVRGQAPDLLVTATRMPGVDGCALARSLRESAPDLPVLFLSGPDAADAGARDLDLGIEDVLPRPVFIRELVARVHLLLARRAQRAVTSDEACGSTADLALADLLQSLEASHRTGVVHLAQDGEIARVHVREGNVVDAELGRQRGADVVVRTLSWDRATFRVEPGPVDNVDLIECTTHALLLRAMDRIDGRPPAHEAIVPAPEPAAPAPEPTVAAPTPEPAPMRVEEQLAFVASEQSVPPTVPWTREASSSDAPEPDLAPAGVPTRDTRSLRRVVIAGVSAAAALAVLAALSAMRARAGDEAPRRQSASEAPDAVAKAVPAAPPAATVGPVATTPAESSATVGDTDTPAASGSEGVAGAMALAAPSTTAGDPHEKALDVKTELHARSPLVRDAERALLQGQTAKALALAQQAVAANPSDAEGWLTLAAVKKALGDLAGARATYQQCISNALTAGVVNCRVLAAR
jgi:DNA-binding response OmpR family regulator